MINIKYIYVLVLFLFFISSFSNLYSQSHPIWQPPDEFQAVSPDFDDYVNLSETELRNYIDTRGIQNSTNADMAYVVYDFAALYYITGDMDYAYKSAILLDEYANVFSQWPRNIGVTRGYYMWWDDWYHRDLGWVARYLPQGYDIIANSGVYEQNASLSKTKILELFRDIINVDLQYPIFMFNSAGTRPLGLMIFARVLNDPELAHLAYWYYNKMLHESYTYDGFWYEGAYDYMAIVTRALLSSNYKKYFNGYTDPADFTSHIPYEKWDTPRLENLDMDERFKLIYNRMNETLWNSAMPNATWPVINETSPYPIGYNGDNPNYIKNILSGSKLYGGFGHAALASGSGPDQTQARLDFSPAFSHYHRDALHLIYFSKQYETVGGTGYVYSNRVWNRSTLNQNLVVIDGTEQTADYWTDFVDSPYTPENGRTTTELESVDFPETNIHNNIVLFETEFQNFNNVQIVEVDAANAYQNIPAKTYQRMLSLVDIDETHSYLVDFFYAQGGTQYDWMLHGGHHDYQIEPINSMHSASGNFGRISIEQQTSSFSQWQADLVYGSATHRLTLLNNGQTEIFTGSAPGSRQNEGNQQYLIARKSATANELTGYYAVHQTFDQSSAIQSINPLAPVIKNEGVYGVQINMAGKTDYIIHSLNPEVDTFNQFIINNQKLEFNGKFMHMRFNGNDIEWIYSLDGTVMFPGHDIPFLKANAFHGNVLDVLRLEGGDSMNAFVTDIDLPNNALLAGKTIIVKWGNGWTWGYKIQSVNGNVITTIEEPGFNIKQGQVEMHYCPAGTYPGPVTFYITGTALYNNGKITTTNPISNDTTPPKTPSIKSINIVE